MPGADGPPVSLHFCTVQYFSYSNIQIRISVMAAHTYTSAYRMTSYNSLRSPNLFFFFFWLGWAFCCHTFTVLFQSSFVRNPIMLISCPFFIPLLDVFPSSFSLTKAKTHQGICKSALFFQKAINSLPIFLLQGVFVCVDVCEHVYVLCGVPKGSPGF